MIDYQSYRIRIRRFRNHGNKKSKGGTNGKGKGTMVMLLIIRMELAIHLMGRLSGGKGERQEENTVWKEIVGNKIETGLRKENINHC